VIDGGSIAMRFSVITGLAGVGLLLTMPQSGAGQAKIEPWSTFRGNPQRTGNTDGVAGPAAPKVLWAYHDKAGFHFVAAPVPVGERVIFPGLGPFNRPEIFALPMNPKGAVEPAWTKSPPYLKLPLVSSPAFIDGKLLFGDGMHQTDGAVLHCIPADGGLPLWQLPVPGELVHMEGGPTVVGKRLYIGGGSAGALCVEWDKATLDGKDYPLDKMAEMQAARWKELIAKYEVDKKKDPDLALPPSEDNLLKFAPKLAWQQGKEKWHVDAPLNVAGDRVLVATAFLEKEKVGDRAVYCLNAATGEPIWRTPLPLNPWGGATITDDAVIVSTSSIASDPKSFKGAKGSVIALGLSDGKERWHKDFPGGVLGCVAVADGLAVFTCTDGKVRGLSLKDGERRLLYDAKNPLFAPPALVAGVAYVADLKGVVHAIDLKSGAPQWQLDLAAEPVSAPGMVYGGITAHGGRLYLGTVNLEGPNIGKPTAIVCIGPK
jgi:outer membrane protein assembly factor BamB